MSPCFNTEFKSLLSSRSRWKAGKLQNREMWRVRKTCSGKSNRDFSDVVQWEVLWSCPLYILWGWNHAKKGSGGDPQCLWENSISELECPMAKSCIVLAVNYIRCNQHVQKGAPHKILEQVCPFINIFEDICRSCRFGTTSPAESVRQTSV